MLSANGFAFSATIKGLRTKTGKSRYRLAQYSGLTEAYLSRLESGERNNLSRNVVVKLGLALASETSAVTLDDVNQLLLSAGYAPLLSRGESISLN